MFNFNLLRNKFKVKRNFSKKVARTAAALRSRALLWLRRKVLFALNLVRKKWKLNIFSCFSF